jgi:hypothetical protein
LKNVKGKEQKLQLPEQKLRPQWILRRMYCLPQWKHILQKEPAKGEMMLY